MVKKQFLRWAFLSSCLIFIAYDAQCSEIYYIDHSPLFLYKTINWWYDSLPIESRKLCGRPIKCTNQGDTQVEYNEPDKKIELTIKGGFASMLSAFRKCRQCYGPSYLHATWLNPDYFNNATITVRTDDASAIGGFTFSNINKAQAQLVKSMERDLQFTLEGVIGGLSSGQIALHESGNLLKKCRATSQEQEHAYPITLKMINASTHESLAILNMFWER